MKIIITLIALNLCSCIMDKVNDPVPDIFIKIVNKSEIDLLYVLSSEGDTLINDFNFLKDETQISLATILKQNSAETGCDCKEYLLTGEILKLYLFDKQTVIEQPWDTIVKNNMILKRYDLSLEDLNSMNWTITYP